MAATQPERRDNRSRIELQARTPLEEIHRRLVRIHYPLAEATAVDQELHARTVQRLMELLNYVDDLANAEQAGKA